MLSAWERQLKHALGHDQRGQADRDTDEEGPAPGQVLDDHATDERAEHGGESERRAHVALVAATLTRRHDVADDRLAERHQATDAEALDGPGAMSIAMFCEKPAANEPAMKIQIADWYISLRP